VLIIVDRNVDLIPMLSHSWTYQSLVHDVLKMNLNQITVKIPTSESQSGPMATKHYDLKANDFFWAKNAGAPFPNVAEDIDAQITQYQDDATGMLKGTGVDSLEALQADKSASSQVIKAAIALLPEMTERKAILDMHMNIATALLQGIKDRQLDNLFQLEQEITKQTKAQILEFINTQKTEPMDKLRLVIIWFLSTEQQVSRKDLDSFEESLRRAGADTTALAWIER
jgi:sec1 family domain-containing protein 1